MYEKWMIVLLAMIIVMPLSSDLYAASKKKKKKGTATGSPAGSQESKSLREVIEGEERGDFKK